MYGCMYASHTRVTCTCDPQIRLILAKVLEGRSCVGTADMREPPKDAAGIRFDSTKDALNVSCRFSWPCFYEIDYLR